MPPETIPLSDAETDYVEFRPVPGTWVSSVQVQDTHTYPMYIRVEYYIDDADTHPEILATGWLRATYGFYNANALVFNKYISNEQTRIRVYITNESGAAINPRVILYFDDQPTNQNNNYDKDLHNGIWALRAVWERKTDAGTMGITITPKAGSWFDLLTCRITAGMTGAEDIAAQVVDTAGTIVQTLAKVNTTAGNIEFPSTSALSSVTATTAESIGASKELIRITYPDALNFTVSSCAATDDITVIMRSRLKDVIPTVTFADAKTGVQAGGTPYSKVI